MNKKTASTTELSTFAKHGGLDFITKAIGAPNSELVDLINWPWPECTEIHGKVIIAAADRERMNTLFHAFGAPLRVESSNLEDTLDCFAFCQAALGKPVKSLIRKATDAEKFLPDWPKDWRDYANAVMSGDIATAETLFSKLAPLSPGTLIPTLEMGGKMSPLDRWRL